MQETTVKINVDPSWMELKICPMMSHAGEVLCKKERCAWWVTTTDSRLGRELLTGCALPIAARFLADLD